MPFPPITPAERRDRERTLPDGATIRWEPDAEAGLYVVNLSTPNGREVGGDEVCVRRDLARTVGILADEWSRMANPDTRHGTGLNVPLCLTCGLLMVYRYPGGDPENGPPVYECPDPAGVHARRLDEAYAWWATPIDPDPSNA